MARPTPDQLDPASYPFRVSVSPRYRDADSNEHLNNGAIADMFETARVLLDRKLEMPSIVGDQPTVVVVSMTIDYLAQAYFPEALEIGLAVVAVGRSSWVVRQIALQSGKPIAFCQATLVHLVGDSAIMVSDGWRTRLNEMAVPVAASAN